MSVAGSIEATRELCVDLELINAAFLAVGGAPAEYRAGIDAAIAKGWLWRHESGTNVKFTPAGAELFA